MVNSPLITLGKLLSKLVQASSLGNGSTWPGHIALKINPHFIQDILYHSKTKIIIVAGTNGKTTTSGLIRSGLEKYGKTVLLNESGANLLNGIASTILLHANPKGYLTQDYAIFEVDENALPIVLKQITPDYLVLLNLFRDQLDRYGEINTITQKWRTTIAKLTNKTKLILNADDPQIAAIPILLKFPKNQSVYFSLHNEKEMKQIQQAADSLSCPRCENNLTFINTTFSHLGKWKCEACGLQQPKPAIDTFTSYPLSGIYNQYNTHAAILVLKEVGMNEKEISRAFESFTPAFGRQEMIQYKNKHVQIFLSKNPTSFNQSFRTIRELKATTILIVLNDRVPDGHDVSWIWDTDLTGIKEFNHIIISGDRTYDMALRIHYEQQDKWKIANEKWTIEPDLKKAIETALVQTKESETLFILPTYSAMLEVRKLLTGRKIL